MNSDLQFTPGFFELRETTGIRSLDDRRLADIGVTRGDDGMYDRDGRLIVEAPARANRISAVFNTLIRSIQAVRPSHA